MKKLSLLLPLIALLFVAALWGGCSSGQEISPSPSSTPTSTVTPTPSPITDPTDAANATDANDSVTPTPAPPDNTGEAEAQIESVDPPPGESGEKVRCTCRCEGRVLWTRVISEAECISLCPEGQPCG